MPDLTTLITSAGYLGLSVVIFAESGLFFGFFLPGDSLLFTAGFLASQNLFRVEILLALLSLAAITGDQVGYWFGAKVGPRLFSRPESRFWKPAHIDRAHEFFVRHGKKAIFLARFLPVIRTFVPIVAGIGKMPYRDFVSYNIAGGLSWIFSMTLLGYFLGAVIPNAEHYLLPIILGIIGVTCFISWLEIRRKH